MFPVLVVSESRNTDVSGFSLCRKQPGALPADPSSLTGLGGRSGSELEDSCTGGGQGAPGQGNGG